MLDCRTQSNVRDSTPLKYLEPHSSIESPWPAATLIHPIHLIPIHNKCLSNELTSPRCLKKVFIPINQNEKISKGLHLLSSIESKSLILIRLFNFKFFISPSNYGGTVLNLITRRNVKFTFYDYIQKIIFFFLQNTPYKFSLFLLLKESY